MKRVAEGDGFVPICSTFCLHAWPRVRDLLDRAESAELGCEIAYRREPTQAEGDAHEYRHADTDAKVAVEWEKLFNERNRLWREEADRVGAVKLLLEANGCDCDCDHDAESHDADCDRCLACRISWAIET
jgi:hypothetical protein